MNSFNFRFLAKFLFPHKSCPSVTSHQAVPNPGSQVGELRQFLPRAKPEAPHLLWEPLPSEGADWERAQAAPCTELTPAPPLPHLQSTSPTLPKQSEEIKCSTYFDLQEMRTPTSLGFSQKFPTDALRSFIFHMKQGRNNHKRCSLQHPAEPSLLPRRSQKLLPFIPYQLQVLSTHRTWHPVSLSPL